MLHDSSRGLAERALAAFRLAHGGRIDDAQLMEMSLNRDLPDLVRYLAGRRCLGPGCGPRPSRLCPGRRPQSRLARLAAAVLVRPLAYGSGRGYAIPREGLVELAGHSDPMISLWAAYALAVRSGGPLEQQSRARKDRPGKRTPTASWPPSFLRALDAQEPERLGDPGSSHPLAAPSSSCRGKDLERMGSGQPRLGAASRSVTSALEIISRKDFCDARILGSPDGAGSYNGEAPPAYFCRRGLRPPISQVAAAPQ